MLSLTTVAAAAIIVFAVVFYSPNDTPSPTSKAESKGESIMALRKPTHSGEESLRAENKMSPELDSIELAFGDGEWEVITWRGLDWNGTPLPPFGHQYEALHQKATDGDRDAAFSLFHILDQCKHSYGSRKELDLAIESARINLALDLPHRDRPLQFSDTEILEQYIARVVAMYHNCEPITFAQTAEADKWLLEAASGGPTEAMTYYALTLDDKNSAVEYLERAWALGGLSSLDALGQTYLALYKSGAEPGNNVKAYAAYYAYATLSEQGTISYGNDVTAVIETHKRQLANVGALLTPSQIEQAVADGLEMIRSNSNCCYSN